MYSPLVIVNNIRGYRLACTHCGKAVSTPIISTPIEPEMGFVLRATITCPECIPLVMK